MNPTQFHILYRQFLFRMVDLELLSTDAQGDTNKLFGQFAALLVAIGIPLALMGAFVGRASLVLQWSGVHFMIATTMLVVGLFAILTWDSTFPDRRDVMVLAPLPIRSRTIFFAKVTAVATALSVTVAALHIFAGFIWPLTLNNRHEATMAPSIAYDPAIAPLGATALEPVLGHDLEPALKTGRLAPDTGAGITVGVWKHGEQRVFAYGAAKPDSLFEIGSITKTFTALALSQLVIQGKARLDEPVRELLPRGVVEQFEGTEITLLDLATHRSGLPREPDNLRSADGHNAWAGYEVPDLYAYLKNHGVAKSPHPSFGYSNLGFGLLGQALANRAGVSYADVMNGITGALGMHDTAVDLSPSQKLRMMQGNSGPHSPVGPMDMGALAGAGAIRSTAADLLRYLSANVHPETVSNADGLRSAIEAQLKLRAQIASGVRIALAWVYDSHTAIYEHDGAMAGYSSYALFSPRGDYAVVVLMNVHPDLSEFVGILGEHIRARLTGERAISLNTTFVRAGGGGVLDFLRLLAVWWTVMIAAGAFIYCCLLGVQGLAAQVLPRPHFLRVSSWVQLVAFAVLVAAYFLEPKLVTPADLISHQSSVYLEWSPSYWFLGLFQQLNGSPALPELARRAWIAIGSSFGVAALAYTLAYFHTLRRIVEEPDIPPASGGRNWLPHFGNGFTTAIGQFSVRTLLRSRQHRLLLAFYLGIGFAAAIFFKKTDETASASGDAVQLSPLCSTIAVMLLCVVGMRIVFSLPLFMRANWIFRISPIPSGPACMMARRRALYALSIVPVCLGTTAMLFTIWPWQPALKHLVLLTLLGTTVAELCLHGTPKLPFTCSYLPGKSNFNITFLLCLNFGFLAIVKASMMERDSFDNTASYTAAVCLLAALAIAARRSATKLAASPEGELQFEESAKPAIFALDLPRTVE